jgi:hypothetical protein
MSKEITKLMGEEEDVYSKLEETRKEYEKIVEKWKVIPLKREKEIKFLIESKERYGLNSLRKKFLDDVEPLLKKLVSKKILLRDGEHVISPRGVGKQRYYGNTAHYLNRHNYSAGGLRLIKDIILQSNHEILKHIKKNDKKEIIKILFKYSDVIVYLNQIPKRINIVFEKEQIYNSLLNKYMGMYIYKHKISCQRLNELQLIGLKKIDIWYLKKDMSIETKVTLNNLLDNDTIREAVMDKVKQIVEERKKVDKRIDEMLEELAPYTVISMVK